MQMGDALQRLFFRLRFNGLFFLCLAAFVSITQFDEPISEPSLAQVKSVDLPVLMYHSFLKDPDRAGKFVISPDVFRSDMAYLKENGYTSISLAALINFVDGIAALPEKPILITIDDGYYNSLTYALPILEEYDMHAVVSIVGSFSEAYSENPEQNPNYAYLSWDDISILYGSGHIDIANHSFSFHSKEGDRNGAQKMEHESDLEYRTLFMDDTAKLQNTLLFQCGFSPSAYCFPYGAVSSAANDCLDEMGIRVSLGCEEKVNTITVGADCLYNLGRFNRNNGPSTESFMKRVLP